jgi:uncharacterized paraquat-inducible protein A
MWRRLVYFWREKSYACPVCGWQGMLAPTTPQNDAECPECGTLLAPRTWMDTWGLTLLILGLVAAAVLFVAYFRQAQ